MEASHRERLLELPARTGPPLYPVQPPRTLADAIAQGEQIAEHERQRLGLRDAPLARMSDLVAAQGLPVFTLDVPDGLSGLFVEQSSVGFAIVVNAKLRHGSPAICHRSWLRPCRLRARWNDPGLRAREREGTDRTARRCFCRRPPPARIGRRGGCAPSRQRAAESAGVPEVVDGRLLRFRRRPSKE
jgi:hypothetical protein